MMLNCLFLEVQASLVGQFDNSFSCHFSVISVYLDLRWGLKLNKNACN